MPYKLFLVVPTVVAEIRTLESIITEFSAMTIGAVGDDWGGVDDGLGDQRGGLGDQGHWDSSGHGDWDWSGDGHWHWAWHAVGLWDWHSVGLQREIRGLF